MTALGGTLITFEGGEGTGKSTQLQMLAQRLIAAELPVVIVREPGGTQVGERVRELLLDPASSIDARAELLLYESSRAALVHEVIRPALEQGAIVLMDRFYDSTTAYQSFGRGLPLDEVEALNRFAADGIVPDRTVVFDLDPAEGLRRATAEVADRLEREDLAFHERVRGGFLEIAQREPERVVVLDAGAGDPASVFAALVAALRGLPALRQALESA